MIQHALDLARRGFEVFPIKAGEKKPPLVAAWQTAATTDETRIREWWATWPNANVGVHCRGMFVLDVDPKKGGYESLDAIEKDLGLEATYETATPSGGRHLYYRLPADAVISNGVDVLGPGLDIRTTGGYVVGAGSATARGKYEVVADEAIAVADAEIVRRVCNRPSLRQERVTEATSTDAGGAVARAIDFLRAHPVAVQGQGGDHHTFRTVCRIRDFGVPQENAEEALAEWNARCQPPWAPAELALKIANAYAYAQDAAGKLTPEALGFEVVEGAADRTKNEHDSTEIQHDEEPPAELLHPADVGLDDVLRVEYLIKGVLEKQSNAVIFGQWNVGKAQPLDEVVLTPEGWREMGSLQVGDYVIGSAGLPVRVSGVYPQGVKEEWAVEFSTGSVVRACGEHLWKVFKNGSNAQIVTTEQLAAPPKHTYSRGRKSAAWNVPLCAPVNYAPNRNPLPLDPYVLGALLGDGGITAYVGFTSADPEIVAEIRARLPAGHELRRKENYAYQIVSPLGQPNYVLTALRLLGLMGKTSPEKEVPEEYMRASPADRLLLLQGLMDTDGWATGGNHRTAVVNFASSSRRLTEQVRELAMSLGGIASRIGTKKTSGLDSHTVSFRLADGANPFRLQRKAARVGQIRAKHIGVRSAIRTGRTVEMRCISVEAPDQLYVTRDFILTHNTFVVLDMAAAIATGQPWFGQRVRQGRVLYLGYEGLRAMKKRMIALRDKHPLLQDGATPFAWSPLRNPLTRPEGVRELGKVLRAFTAKHGGAPDLVIIDPLANALGGDDADANLMAELNRCVAEIMRKQRCTVLRVHHSGHGNQERGRGHSSLPAGVDTEILVTKDAISTTKQRDDQKRGFGFDLKIVPVGQDSDGDKVTTCVVVQRDDNPLSPELTRTEREVLDALIARRGDNGHCSKDDVKSCSPGLTMPQRKALLAVLEKKQFLRPEGRGWVICERGPASIFD